MNGSVSHLACLSGQGYVMLWTVQDRYDSLLLITVASLFLILLLKDEWKGFYR